MARNAGGGGPQGYPRPGEPTGETPLTGPLYRLGRFCVRRRWIVTGAWIALVAGIAAAALAVGEQTNDDLTLPGSDSQRATDLLDDRFPAEANGTSPVVMRAPSGKLTDGRYAHAVRATANELRGAPEVRDAVSPLGQAGGDALTGDERIGYISVTLEVGPGELTDEEAEEIVDATAPAADAGLEVATGGPVGDKVSQPSTHSSEAIGLVAAVVVLLMTFGTVVAMGLPIVTAVLGLVSGLSLVALLGQIVQVPTVAPTLATMIGLGVGIDYALFVVTRHREQMKAGLDVEESIARANATAGGAVVFAGGTVIIALLSLALAGIPLVTTLGYSSAIVVAIAIVGAITLLPAVLAIVGPRIERLRLPLGRRFHDAKPHGWARWARFVASHPWPALAFSVAVLAVLAAPILSLRLGQEDDGALPTSTESRRAYDLMTEGFGAGSNGPMLIAVELADPAKPDKRKLDELNRQVKRQKQKQKRQADAQEERATEQLEAEGVPAAEAESEAQSEAQKQQAKEKQKQKRQAGQTREERQFLESPASDPRLVKLRKDLKRTPGVDSVTQPLVKGDGGGAVYTLTPATAPSAFATQDLVADLRSTVIPEAVSGKGMRAFVGGQTAGFIDLADDIAAKLPFVIGTVILLSFVVLLLAFRSLFIPLKAGLMNLLSIGAALGVVTAIFEKGWGEQLVGLDQTVPVVSFVPLLMFAILFGLSMDYEVFLMTRMKEHYEESGDNHEAVVGGLASTGRVITSAALIMVSVFCSFVLNGDPTVKQFGVGLAVAIAVDATVVRCLLVPVLMTLLGRGNWWMPRWLARITPRISIEGAEYFRRRDRAASG